ncbi:MAG: tRNA pseudouridine(13) synthase TruD [Planctomycetota bacterium]|jgi:tRNA pseudouridine13 synthase
MKRLTEDIPGTGGRLRVEPEDFEVEEVPLYPASGEGEHVILEIEKRGIPTREAVRRIARALGVDPEDAGVAGQKDARAVARQRVSVRGSGIDERRAASVDVPGVRVLSAMRHGNKLRLGHLGGNRFRILVRGVEEGALEHARAALGVLARRGMPNRFGPQRFGERGDGHLAGAAILRGDAEEALALMLGRASDLDPPGVRRSREAYDGGDLKSALRALPRSRRDEARVLTRLLKGERPDRALRAYPKRMRLFLISALQSHLFNEVLDARLPDLDHVEPGGLAWKHDSGAVFRVEDAEAEAERAARFEISPSGPMFGFKMAAPTGRPGEVERAVRERAGLTPESFRAPGGLKSKGARRPLRVPLGEARAEECADGIVVEFSLPPGSYATVAMDEVMKA